MIGYVFMKKFIKVSLFSVVLLNCFSFPCMAGGYFSALAKAFWDCYSWATPKPSLPEPGERTPLVQEGNGSPALNTGGSQEQPNPLVGMVQVEQHPQQVTSLPLAGPQAMLGSDGQGGTKTVHDVASKTNTNSANVEEHNREMPSSKPTTTSSEKSTEGVDEAEISTADIPALPENFEEVAMAAQTNTQNNNSNRTNEPAKDEKNPILHDALVAKLEAVVQKEENMPANGNAVNYDYGSPSFSSAPVSNTGSYNPSYNPSAEQSPVVMGTKTQNRRDNIIEAKIGKVSFSYNKEDDKEKF